MRLVYAWVLYVGAGLLRGSAGAVYPLSPFDTVQIDDLQGNHAALLVVPSIDGTYSLNASMQGLSYTVNPATDTLELSQVTLELDPISSLLDDVFHDEDNKEQQQQGNSTSGDFITIAVGGPLLAVWSAASNDVILASNFTSDSFTSQNLGSGKLIALAVLTGRTTVSNTGSGTTYVQGDLGWVEVHSSGDGGIYLGASSQYPGSIASVSVDMSGTGNIVVATSNASTVMYGRSYDVGKVMYNQGTCNVTGPAEKGPSVESGPSACTSATIGVPLLARYWAQSAAAVTAVSAMTPPPPPKHYSNSRVPAKELTNLVTTLEAIPTPAPAPSPATAPAAVPTLMPVPHMAPDSQEAPLQAPLPALHGTNLAAVPGQANAQPAPQPLVGDTEGPPAVDVGSVMPFNAAASGSSFVHEVPTQSLEDTLGG